MKYYVYCLISIKNPNFHYYGYTKNPRRRLIEHLTKKVRTTRRFHPVALLGYEEFGSKIEALRYEKLLKTNSYERMKFIKSLQNKAHLPARLLSGK